MTEIGLIEAIDAVRRELASAMIAGKAEDIHFPVGQVTLEFHVGVSKSTEAGGGIRVWVLELGGKGQYAKESIQTVTVALDPPVDSAGNRIKVAAASVSKPS